VREAYGKLREISKQSTLSLSSDPFMCYSAPCILTPPLRDNGLLLQTSDPFTYWNNSDLSPSMKEVATKYLTVVATSVPS